MRSTWNNGWRIFGLIVFLSVSFLYPCRIIARESIADGTTAVYERYEYGEPGHDPFSRGKGPSGNGERNGGGGQGAECIPPGPDGGDIEHHPLLGCYQVMKDFFGSMYGGFERRLKSLN
jgi:hypothetical protein